MIESSSFFFDSIHWLYKPDNSIASDRNVRKTQKAGLREVTVKCKSCNHIWLATASGSGRFTARAGGQHTFSCPECSAREHISLTIFE